MLNAEKFKDEILKTLDCDCEGFGVTEDNKITMCRADSFCCICSFLKDGFCSREAKDRWLLSEYKEPVKLSRLEHDILKYLSDNTRHMYIIRNKDGKLFLYDTEPKKIEYNGRWEGRGVHGMVMFNKLFQFVQWEDLEPTSIQEVLENCEVVDYD